MSTYSVIRDAEGRIAQVVSDDVDPAVVEAELIAKVSAVILEALNHHVVKIAGDAAVQITAAMLNNLGAEAINVSLRPVP